MTVKPIPEGFHTVTPYVSVTGADRFIEFLKNAFDAEEQYRLDSPRGIGHAQVSIGDSNIMISEKCDEWPSHPASLYLYVPDVDAVYRQALAAGATSVTEPADQFYGDRSAGVRDAFGNTWWIGTHIEDVPNEEIARRAQALFAKKS
ncbi:Glyoxalase-like domain protein [Pigmentiphaga humi]|uniref:Glyoxalase-like domain protein n=1 Tax=Pigmentiphaga humi TaxID=2478468 RepID=A0A3P4B6V8_9BURK|nr:VOC family protein [Pigmentiphaga humi]VCU70905.1 Glyoxalase-like domain protein [Pigmentiphaga humi]